MMPTDDYKQARGCAPSLSGMSPEEAIRRGRGDCPECERLRAENAQLASQCFTTVKSWKDRLTAKVGVKGEECERLKAEIDDLRADAVVAAKLHDHLLTVGQRMCQALWISTNMTDEALVKACERLRARLATAERVAKAVAPLDAAEGAMANAYSHKDVIESKRALLIARTELDLALEAWEEA